MIRPILLAACIGLGAAPAAWSQNSAGSYLAGRSAQLADDFQASADYLSTALSRGVETVGLKEALIGSYMSLGRWDRAAAVAERTAEDGPGSQIAALARFTVMGHAGNWDDMLQAFDDGLSVGPLYDGIARAWALVGTGDPDAAMEAFQSIGQDGTVRAFALYHRALALAALERFDEAAALLGSEETLQLTRNGIAARAQILAQTGDPEAAIAVIEDSTGNNVDPILDALRTRLENGEVPDFTIAPDAEAGLGELNFDIANAVVGETPASYALLYSRAAQYLNPDHSAAALLSAMLFQDVGQYDLATDAYATIPEGDPAWNQAELGRAEVLREAGDDAAAIDAMRNLAEANPDNALIQITLADTLRELQRFEEARTVYDSVIAQFDAGSAEQWAVYFARAITEERLDDWDAAEADFRRALELNEDQPQVLNYLGYSLVIRGEKLDEALGMIERAVAARPESGHIIDSLGWGLYTLGRYDEAVEPMERAVELMPVDPVVNDHLGDVLWAVGREIEARFQWQRALSFVDSDDSGEADPERIRRKIEVGLDQVLREEGADPLRMANDDG